MRELRSSERTGDHLSHIKSLTRVTKLFLGGVIIITHETRALLTVVDTEHSEAKTYDTSTFVCVWPPSFLTAVNVAHHHRLTCLHY